MAAKRGIQAASLRGRRVLVRVDFNVPQEANGRVADDRRIQEALPTLNHLRAAGARTILMSHLGRPEGRHDPRFTLKPVVHRLSAILGQPVPLASDIIGIQAIEGSARLANGEFLMLENLRFHPGEEANDPAFAAALARLGELFVEDAFGTLHRAHASTVGVPSRLPSYAGFLVEREVRELSRLVERPERPYVALLGGAKVTDKLPLLASFLGRADTIAIGGALAFPFLAHRGHTLGATEVEGGLEDVLVEFDREAMGAKTEIVLPTDAVIERPGTNATDVVEIGAIPPDAMIRDIGPATVARFRGALQDSRTVFWNGPFGKAEDPRFAAGTRDVLAHLASIPGYHVGAGGDSARIAQDLGVTSSFQFLSTGGGAALEFVQGTELPGLAVLPDA
ncbi:MAG TPA: phosphoglycerate kinase [Thermoplasmata archaeon]|nr:phosphoglycerate kinase [Thermoplasmata archaeon]